MNSAVLALTVFDDGSGGGPALHVGGWFTTAAAMTVNRIAKWDGTSWSPLGSGMNDPVYALTVFDDGTGGGPALYAGGAFTIAGGVAANHIAKWDGTTWSALGSGTNANVFALTVFDDGSGGGPALYAGGEFRTVDGMTAQRIAKWNGAAWSTLGGGTNSSVRSLAVFDDGNGAALYAAGWFNIAGGAPALRIARWDGIEWSALGAGLWSEGSNAWIEAITVFDDGSGDGPALYAGGWFTNAGEVEAACIAKWNGTAWSALGSGVNQRVRALTAYDDGTGRGPVLYAGGDFTIAGGKPVSRLAKWDGTDWSSPGGGVHSGTSSSTVYAFVAVTEEPGAIPALYVGGSFRTAGTTPSFHIAKWQGCEDATAPCPEDLNNDGTVDITDLLTILAAWGACEGCPEDLNGNGVVDMSDLLQVLGAWGECP